MMNIPATGKLLIANPHLNDPNFLRSVVVLCSYTAEEGAFGFVINKKLTYTVNELVPELSNFALPVFEGGPVELNTLHFLHQCPEYIDGGKEIIKGVYWGGDFQQLITAISSGTIDAHSIRFYLGYSGWSCNQLEMELEEQSWIVAKATPELLFRCLEKEVWKESLQQLGGAYELLINAPLDPRMN